MHMLLYSCVLQHNYTMAEVGCLSAIEHKKNWDILTVFSEVISISHTLHSHCGYTLPRPPMKICLLWHCSSFGNSPGCVFVAALVKCIPFAQRTIDYLLAEVCLSWQVVEINALELEQHSLLSEHMEELLLQRRQRIKDTANRLQQLSCKNCLICVRLWLD